VSNVVAAALFVLGCIGFYWPRLFTASITAFLCGSVLFLLTALSAALEQSPLSTTNTATNTATRKGNQP
jgi:hypothetical protein